MAGEAAPLLDLGSLSGEDRLSAARSQPRADEAATVNQSLADRAEIDADGTYRIANLTEEMVIETILAELPPEAADPAPNALEQIAAALTEPRTDIDAPADTSTVPLPDKDASGTLSQGDLTLLDEADRAASGHAEPLAELASEAQADVAEIHRDTERAASHPEQPVDSRAEAPRSALPTLPVVPVVLFQPTILMPMAPTQRAPASNEAMQSVDPVDENASGNGDPRDPHGNDRQDAQDEANDAAAGESMDEDAGASDTGADAYHLYRLLADQA